MTTCFLRNLFNPLIVTNVFQLNIQKPVAY